MKIQLKNYTNERFKISKDKDKDSIWAADFGEIGSLSSKNRGVKYILCLVDVLLK